MSWLKAIVSEDGKGETKLQTMNIRKTDDAEYAKYMKKKLKANSGYCPNELEKTPDTKCPCKAFREQTAEGYCGCGYYYKEMEENDN